MKRFPTSTVRVENANFPNGVLINASDFNPDTHKLFADPQADLAEAQKELTEANSAVAALAGTKATAAAVAAANAAVKAAQARVTELTPAPAPEAK